MTTVVVESGAGYGLSVVTEVEDGGDDVEAGDDVNGELVGSVEEYEDIDAGDEDVCVVKVIGNGKVDVGAEVGVTPDIDGDDEIAQDEVNIVPDVVNRDVSEAETPELELKVEESGRLVPALVLVSAVDPGESEVEETLESN